MYSPYRIASPERCGSRATPCGWARRPHRQRHACGLHDQPFVAAALRKVQTRSNTRQKPAGLLPSCQ